jgi:hypothetical protein
VKVKLFNIHEYLNFYNMQFLETYIKENITLTGSENMAFVCTRNM